MSETRPFEDDEADLFHHAEETLNACRGYFRRDDERGAADDGPTWSGVILRSHTDEDGTRVIDEVRLYGVAPEIFP